MSLPTLSDARGLVHGLLMDSAALIYDNATLDQCLRQALGDLGQVYGGLPALKDLDGAQATTLEALDVPALVLGAAGYAVRARCVDLSEVHSPTGEAPPALREAGKGLLAAFSAALEGIRLRRLQNASGVPYADVREELEDRD